MAAHTHHRSHMKLITLLLGVFLAAAGVVEGRMISVKRTDSGKTIVLEVNDSVRIELGGSPTTGYQWALESERVPCLELVKKGLEGTRVRGVEGAPGTYVWQFRAVKPGTCALKARYARSWESDVPPADRFEIGFTVVPVGTKGRTGTP